MTFQIRDGFMLNEQHYSIWQREGEGYFNPDDHGVQRQYGGTGCYRGYYATYHLQNNWLELLELIVGRKLESVASFNGVEPMQLGSEKRGDISRIGYTNLGFKVPFTGGLVIVAERLHSKRGIGPELLWRFVHVNELIFEEGQLVTLFDRSPAIAELREQLLQREAHSDFEFPEIRTPEIMEAYNQRVHDFYKEMEIEIDRRLELDYHKRDSG